MRNAITLACTAVILPALKKVLLYINQPNILKYYNI